MSMSMMHIRKMPVCVSEQRMLMLVSVGLTRGIVCPVFVLVMGIMCVPVVMLQQVMDMFVVMIF